MAVDPCQVVDALAAANLDLLRRINRKFAALHSLAQLLEQLGDLAGLFPNLGALVPVVNIDIQLYTELAVRCPQLNLPPVTTGQVNNLQAMLVGAYSQFLNKLLNHPWNRMNQLQAQLNDFLFQIQTPINFGLSQVQDFLGCLQAVCAAGRAVASQLQSFSNADIGKEITTFANNFAAKGGQVLTQPMQNKVATLQAMQRQLIDLGATSKNDYATAKAALGK